MTLRADLETVFDASDDFEVTPAGEAYWDAKPVVFTRYGGSESNDGRHIIELVLLTGVRTDTDPYKGIEEAVEKAVTLCYAAGGLPLVRPIYPLHNWQPSVGSKQGYVGAVISVVDTEVIGMRGG